MASTTRAHQVNRFLCLRTLVLGHAYVAFWLCGHGGLGTGVPFSSSDNGILVMLVGGNLDAVCCFSFFFCIARLNDGKSDDVHSPI